MHWITMLIGLIVLILLLMSFIAICTDSFWRRIAKYLLLGAASIFVLYTYINADSMQQIFKW